MDWMEYTVLTTTEASELISQVLLDAGSSGTMIEDKNDVALNQRPEGRWDIIDEAIALRIGDDVKTLGSRAFADCASLEEIAIPATVTDIAPDAFAGVNGLVIIGTPGTAAEDCAVSCGAVFHPVQ